MYCDGTVILKYGTCETSNDPSFSETRQENNKVLQLWGNMG